MEYEFRFVVEGTSVDDDAAVLVLERELDAMLFRGGGVDLLDIASEGQDAFDAAMNAARAVHKHVPKLHLIRLHRDLVGIPEIAERVGVSRQNVHQWTTGKRRTSGAAPFPTPEGTAGRTHVWLWSEVSFWLDEQGQGDGINRPTRAEMADIDSALSCRLYLSTESSVMRWRRTRTFTVMGTYKATVDFTDYEEIQQPTPDALPQWEAATTSDYKVAVL